MYQDNRPLISDYRNGNVLINKEPNHFFGITPDLLLRQQAVELLSFLFHV